MVKDYAGSRIIPLRPRTLWRYALRLLSTARNATGSTSPITNHDGTGKSRTALDRSFLMTNRRLYWKRALCGPDATTLTTVKDHPPKKRKTWPPVLEVEKAYEFE